VDFCCGGKRPLSAVCQDLGLTFADVAREIEDASREPGADRDWTTAPLQELTGHIVTTYHDALREDLPRLQALANRSARVHGPKAPGLFDRMHAALDALSNELIAHMRKEEAILFPAIGLIEGGGRTPVPLAQAIRVMESEHDDAGNLLSELRTITGGYAAPEWACATVRALYQGLEALESAMHVHVHLENNVLFPRTLRLLDGQAAA
jgi:regulator of cell morphogenesis and NO signaling